jgi:hypothetical protein
VLSWHKPPLAKPSPPFPLQGLLPRRGVWLGKNLGQKPHTASRVFSLRKAF